LLHVITPLKATALSTRVCVLVLAIVHLNRAGWHAQWGRGNSKTLAIEYRGVWKNDFSSSFVLHFLTCAPCISCASVLSSRYSSNFRSFLIAAFPIYFPTCQSLSVCYGQYAGKRQPQSTPRSSGLLILKGSRCLRCLLLLPLSRGLVKPRIRCP
jgi:hypothetical protein